MGLDEFGAMTEDFGRGSQWEEENILGLEEFGAMTEVVLCVWFRVGCREEKYGRNKGSKIANAKVNAQVFSLRSLWCLHREKGCTPQTARARRP